MSIINKKDTVVKLFTNSMGGIIKIHERKNLKEFQKDTQYTIIVINIIINIMLLCLF